VGRLPLDVDHPGTLRRRRSQLFDHGANRLGASALMQGLADGYFILPYTLPNYIASSALEKIDTSHPRSRPPRMKS